MQLIDRLQRRLFILVPKLRLGTQLIAKLSFADEIHI
jgi:hypothetical protein